MPSTITASKPQNQPFWPTGLTTMFDDHGQQHDELAAGDRENAPDARLNGGRVRTVLLDERGDPSALGAEETGAE